MKWKSPVPAGKYLEGAGLALKAGQKYEAAEFFFKGGEFETAAILFEKLGRHDRAAFAHEKADNTVEAAAAWSRAGEHSKAAELYANAGRTREAAVAFGQAGEYMRAAELYAEAERFLDAAKMASEANAEKAMIGYLQKVPADHADYREAVVVLARALIRRGWSGLAIDAIETALGEDDDPLAEHSLELFSRRNAVRASDGTRTVHDGKPRETPSRVTRATHRARAIGATGIPRSSGDAVSVEKARRALRIRARGARLGSVR